MHAGEPSRERCLDRDQDRSFCVTSEDMLHENAASDPVCLVLDEERASVLTASECRAIPSVCSKRSVLITELLEQQNGTVTLPLPLEYQEIVAWLACASSPAAGTPEGHTHDDATLLRAIKAAGFLRDETTLAEATDALAAAVHSGITATGPIYVYSRPSRREEQPAAAELRARACEIMETAPLDTVVAILSTIKNRYTPDKIWPRSETNTSISLYLRLHCKEVLQIVPRASHPAIVQAVCLSPSDHRSCVLHLDITCACTREETANGVCECGYRSPAMQLLEAVLPHAGAAEQAGTSGHRLGPQLSNLHLQQLQLKDGPASARDKRSWRLPGDHLTRLELHMNLSFETPAGPARWWHTLRRMRTLRELCIVMPPRPFQVDLRAHELSASLHFLPELQQLHVTYSNSQQAGRSVDYAPATVELLDGVTSLTQLASLSLNGTALSPRTEDVDVSSTYAACVTAMRVIFQLPRLSVLTQLTFSCVVYSTAWAGVFAEAVEQMPALKKLDVGVAVRTAEGAAARGELLLALVSRPGLSLLDNFKLGAGRNNSFLTGTVFPPRSLHECLLLQHAAVLTRITALRLNGMFDQSASESDGANEQREAVAAMIADLPALKSLCLADNGLQDSGLVRLAHVLHALSGLTDLNVSYNNAGEEGVLAVLRGLLQPGAAGPERLRHLHIGGNPIIGRRARALEDALRQLRGLTQLNVRDMLLESVALSFLSEALKALPHLSVVHKGGNALAPNQTEFTGSGRMPDLPDAASKFALEICP